MEKELIFNFTATYNINTRSTHTLILILNLAFFDLITKCLKIFFGWGHFNSIFNEFVRQFVDPLRITLVNLD